MLVGAFVMASISSYLMYVLAFKLHTVCYYCIGSALFSFSLLLLTLLGHDWEDIGQVVFTGAIVILLSLVTTLGVYARVDVTQTPGGVETEMAQGAGFGFPGQPHNLCLLLAGPLLPNLGRQKSPWPNIWLNRGGYVFCLLVPPLL